MEISSRQVDEFVEMSVSGRLDAYWAEPLSDAIEEAMRGGADRIRLDLAEVTYISSVGIRVLLKFYKQMQRINGMLVVSQPSEAVKTVLELAGLQLLLAGEASMPASAQRVGRALESNGIGFEVYDYSSTARLRCRLVGEPQRLLSDGYAAAHSRSIRFGESALAVGLGAFGNDFEECRNRFGEFLVAGGAAAYLPTDGSNVPDYLVSARAFVPELQVLYALICEGGFAAMARFDRSGGGEAIALSQVVNAALELACADSVGLVMIAESAGLKGATLRRSPALAPPANGFFRHPEVREWLSFSAERCHTRSLALVAGVATRARDSALDPFVRGMVGGLRGHLHAAALSYRPLPKGEIELVPTVASLLEAETLQGVLHLIGDDRGGGESELVRGACWFAPIAEIASE